MDRIEELEEELAKARTDEKEAGERRSRLTKELAEAKLAAAHEKGHPWLGKKVERTVKRGFRNMTVRRQGRVALYDPVKHRGLRELAYSIQPGEPIVISASGMSGWKLNLAPDQIHPIETPWALCKGESE